MRPMPDPPPRKLAVILHADVVGSTTLVQRDESLAHERIKDAFLRFATTISSYGGTAREIRGDALVAEFSRASDAVCAALAFQSANTDHNTGISGEIRPELRVGISMGEVVISDGTVTGAGVVLAQRLEQLATPGGVVVQGSVADTVPTRLPLDFESLGERALKGFDQPVRAFVGNLRPSESLPLPQSVPVIQTERFEGLGKAQTPELPDRPSIAVLPFTNMSGDPEQEYFSDGITEDIITELSRYREFSVMARNSTFTYKGKTVDIREVGRDLGVTHVVEGSVRKAGNRIRVTAQVIDAASGDHVWAERYDRELNDIFAVQDELTRAIVSLLPIRVQKAIIDSAGHKPTQNLTAYDYYLRGRWIFEQSSGEDPAALELFQKALQADPECAHAYAFIAVFYSYSLFSLRAPQVEAEKLAKEYIRRALAYGEGDATIHAEAASVYVSCGDHQLASSHAEKAIALNRNELNAILSYGFVKTYLGELEEGMRWLLELEKLDPLSPGYRLELVAECHYLLGNYQSAIDVLSRWQDPPLHTYAHLAACYAQLGQMNAVKKFVATYERECPADVDFARYAAAHQKLCKREEDAEHWLEGYRKAGFID